MSEVLTRHEPVTGTPFVADGVRISLAPPMQRHALREKKKEETTPELFLNRELSWLDFNGRVLEEAQDAQNSIAEQMLKDERIMGVMQKMLAKMAAR